MPKNEEQKSIPLTLDDMKFVQPGRLRRRIQQMLVDLIATVDEANKRIVAQNILIGRMLKELGGEFTVEFDVLLNPPDDISVSAEKIEQDGVNHMRYAIEMKEPEKANNNPVEK